MRKERTLDTNLFRRDKLPITQQKILMYLEKHSPLSQKDLAKYLECTIQTVSNNLSKLRAIGLVEEAPRLHHYSTWQLTESNFFGVTIVWQGEPVSLTHLLKDIAKDNTPVADPYQRQLIKAMAILLNYAADAIDPDDPKTIDIGELKNLQHKLHTLKNNLQLILDAYNSVLLNSDLFDPRELPAQLIIKDPAMGPEFAKTIAKQVIPLMNVRGSKNKSEDN